MPSNNITGPDDPRVIACKEAKGKMGAKLLGQAIGMQRQAVQNWQIIPAEHVRAVEKATGVSRYRLRPDVFGAEPERGKGKRSGDSVAA